jgi:hypothetical protein
MQLAQWQAATRDAGFGSQRLRVAGSGFLVSDLKLPWSFAPYRALPKPLHQTTENMGKALYSKPKKN